MTANPPTSEPVVATPDGEVVVEHSPAHLAPPASATNDRIWTLIVGALCLVALAVAVTLCVGVFVPASGATQPALLLSIFTGTAGVLAGLLAPSPGAKP